MKTLKTSLSIGNSDEFKDYQPYVFDINGDNYSELLDKLLLNVLVLMAIDRSKEAGAYKESNYIEQLEKFKNNINTEEVDKILEVYGKTEKEITLENVLRAANDICRTMSSITERQGKATNWEGFKSKLDQQLDIQHKLLYK